MGVIEPLLPIVLLVLTGFALRRSGFFDEAIRRGLDRFVYWVALPALLMVKLATAEQVDPTAWPMLGAFAAATTAVALSAFILGRLFGMPDTLHGVFVQSSLRGNLAFVGLPVVILADPGDTPTITNTLLVMGPVIVLYNVLSVGALVMAHEKVNGGALRRLAWTMASNPFILACVVGLTLQFAGFRVPRTDTGAGAWPAIGGVAVRSLVRTLELLGQTAGPLALLSLGGAMVVFKVREHIPLALLSSAGKCAAVPLMTWWLASRWGVSGGDLRAVVILAATPTAVASYVLAGQLRGDQGFAAAAIVVSTFGSAVSLAVALSLGDA